ncbi:MAG: 2-oxoacid:acceptor oxidoreductase subunit alpha [Syntrophales bacterium]
MPIDVNFMVGGEAGQGVQSVGFLLAKAFARGGYYIFADQDYESRIRGGHNFFRVRVSDSKVDAIAEPLDMLIALNKETIDLHREELVLKGIVLFDGEEITNTGGDNQLFSVPVNRMAEEKAGNKLSANTVALGAALGLVGYDLEILVKVLRDHFGAGEVADNNVNAATAGYEYARQNFKGNFAIQLKPISDVKRMLLTGNEAVALGVVAAGCKFVAAYPMTPVTSIMEYLVSKADDAGIVVIQPEDEIAAVNMAIGAGYAGVRAMTATSGGGFSLMVEALSLSGMTETPVVVILGQRAGPAIGLPTRTEQGELEFAVHAGHGEFPRVVLAPATIEDSFRLTIKAFNLAERYQAPVILLTDHYLATSYSTVDKFDLSGIAVDRGLLFSVPPSQSAYKRYRVTESGISPRAFPGQEDVLVVADSDEHDENGHPIEDAKTRVRMMQKRMRKLFSLGHEIASPKIYGPRRAETTLIGWGSTYGAICEASDILRKEGRDINTFHLNELWPFPDERVSAVLDSARKSYVIENNATGQLSRLIRAETGRKVSGKILKCDGRPFTPADIAREIRKAGC